MSPRRVVALALLSGAILPLPHSGALGAEPVPTPGPGVCGGRPIPLEEGERFEERTLFFRGNTAIGNVDGHNEANTGTPGLRLSAEAPTSADEKMYAARPTGVIGNANSNRNPHQGYWWRQQAAPERIVCAGAKVFAATATGNLTIQLWVNKPRGAGTPTRSVVGAAAANQVSEFKINFGALDETADDNVVIQLDSAPPGALAFYDSTDRPSQFNYVVIVRD